MRYFGTGDQGGTPDEESVQWAQKSIEDKAAPVRVVNTSADQLAKDLTPAEIAALPHYKGELVMKTHGVGLLHVPGRPQEVEPDERADGGCSGARIACRRMAWRTSLPARGPPRGLDTHPLASVP